MQLEWARERRQTGRETLGFLLFLLKQSVLFFSSLFVVRSVVDAPQRFFSFHGKKSLSLVMHWKILRNVTILPIEIFAKVLLLYFSQILFFILKSIGKVNDSTTFCCWFFVEHWCVLRFECNKKCWIYKVSFGCTWMQEEAWNKNVLFLFDSTKFCSSFATRYQLLTDFFWK